MKRASTVLITSFVWVIGSLFLWGGLIKSACAENHAESTMETRAVVALQVQMTELQKWVPDAMQIAPPPAGPFTGANLFINLIDVFLLQDPQGKPFKGGIYRNAVFAVPVKHKTTGEMVFLVIDGLTDNPENVPGAYKKYKLAAIRRNLNYSFSGAKAGKGSDDWQCKDKSGVLIDFHVGYERAIPMRTKLVQKVYSGAEPTFYRIYKTDYLADVVKSVPAKLDRSKDYRLKVSMPELAKLFDGTEQLVAIALFPAYVREVFLP